MKRNKLTAGVLIIAVLALLLFFSKTFYAYTLPKVTGVRPSRGSLSKLELSSGVASWTEKENLYAQAAGVVGRVYVKEGETVTKGQILFAMDFDLPQAERKLAETRNNISKLEADIQNTRARLESVRKALASGRAGDEESAAALSGQAGLIVLEIGKARLALENIRLGFPWASSQSDLTNAENALKSLFFKYEAEAEELGASLAAKNADLQNLRLNEETARELLRDYQENALIRSPVDGFLISLPAERKKYFPENALLASIGAGKEFTVECSVSLDNNFVNIGDSCELSNTSHVLTGTVARVKPAAQGKTVSISIVSEEVSDGETFEVAFEKKSAAAFTLVPNSAVNQDNDGYFVYQIKRRKGIMGDEYYLERLNIFTGDSDREKTAVIRGITFFEPVVSSSNKVLASGVTVSLQNAGDFFEN
ncbi:MAG: HlyD family secretion protein [Treponema sp.]|nr:HlyD family secretion protein [Treponema sp.]